MFQILGIKNKGCERGTAELSPLLPVTDLGRIPAVMEPKVMEPKVLCVEPTHRNSWRVRIHRAEL